jgi:hypothetical protein
LSDAAGPGFENGHRNRVPVFIEDLGHPDLSTEDPFHLCHLWMPLSFLF